MQNLIDRITDDKVTNAVASTVSVISGVALIWAGLSKHPTAVSTRNGLRDGLTGLASGAIINTVTKAIG